MITLEDVTTAARWLDGVARRTPVLTSTALDRRVDTSLFIKAEIFQRAGSFKYRGAYTKTLNRDVRKIAPALKGGGVEGVYAIGDVVARRFIADHVFDVHRLAREIGSSDPARPLPYLRERGTADHVTDAAHRAAPTRPADMASIPGS